MFQSNGNENCDPTLYTVLDLLKGTQLKKMLLNKDKQILEEEKLVKELLSKNINNYMHEEYLKYRKAELLSKEKYLESEIADLDKKYNTFHDDFALASKKAKELDNKISSAIKSIEKLKEHMKEKKENAFLKRYKTAEVKDIIANIYHENVCEGTAKDKVRALSEQIKVKIDGDGSSEKRVE